MDSNQNNQNNQIVEALILKIVELSDTFDNERKEIAENAIEELLQLTEGTANIDSICVSVPLFIRLLEFAREDATNDLSLHYITENALRVHSQGTSVLGMKNYKEIVKK